MEAKTVTLREANQTFARCVREVESGTEFVITRNGRPVARLVPIGPATRRLSPQQEAARQRVRSRMRQGWPIAGGALDRDDLHER
jgi:prevent-host-death family protein